MILTNTLIDETILKAKCCLANFAVKYAKGLSYGKNDTCILQKINLIDRYLCVLDDFQLESDNPCDEPVTNCVSREQVIKIIKHINKLCKYC